MEFKSSEQFTRTVGFSRIAEWITRKRRTRGKVGSLVVGASWLISSKSHQKAGRLMAEDRSRGITRFVR